MTTRETDRITDDIEELDDLAMPIVEGPPRPGVGGLIGRLISILLPG
jgi:hypothetical protein